jgi:hypothetical protein
MENKQEELVNLIVRTYRITKTRISKFLGFKAVTSFYTSNRRGGLTMNKVEKLLDKYGIEMAFKVKPEVLDKINNDPNYLKQFKEELKDMNFKQRK